MTTLAMISALHDNTEVELLVVGDYDVTYNPNMGGGEWEVWDHYGNHMTYTPYHTADDVLAHVIA